MGQISDTKPRRIDWRVLFSKAMRTRCAVIFGSLSITLYTLLYFFSQDLIQIAQSTQSGHKSLFFIPIIVALVFSVIHGSFTSHFWDVLGVKAKK